MYMKNTAINMFGYTGTVTFSQYIDGEKVRLLQRHNTGTNSLFDFLADCLCGDFSVAESKRPCRIKLLNRSEQGEVSSVSDFLYSQTIPEKIYTDNSISVVYSFVVPRAYLDKSFNGLGLYADYEKDINNYAAFCPIKDKPASSNSSVLLVDWALTLSNLNTYIKEN